MLRLEMLPAAHGDALLLEYGPGDTATHRTLIDAGPSTTYRHVRERLLALPERDGHRDVELLIVTHVDADHIEGVIRLLQDDEVALRPGDVWFNDWNHLEPLERGSTPERLGPEQGEFLGALLDDQGHPWNDAFDGGVIMVPEDLDQDLPAVTTPGGLKLTVLSPTIETLLDLRRTWRKAIEAAGFQPGDRQSALREFARRRWAKAPRLGDEAQPRTLDHSEANGSSIAVIAEYGTARLLLTGDAFAPVLRASLERWRDRRGADREEPVTFDGFKLPHHGSAANVTPQLLDVLATPTYLISTSGARFRHPDREAIELILDGHRHPTTPELRFNYRSPYTRPWGSSPRCHARYEDDAILAVDTGP